MLSRVSLVAILLTLNCMIRATECTRPPLIEERRHEVEGDVVAPGRRVLRYTHVNVTSESSPPLTSPSDNIAKDKLAEVKLQDAYSKIGVEERGNSIRRSNARLFCRRRLSLELSFSSPLTKIPTRVFN